MPEATPAPLPVETVVAAGVVTELVALPATASQLAAADDVPERVEAAIAASAAPLLALAGMLPVWTGLD